MRINLLPPEIRERHRARRLTIAILAGGLVLLIGLGGLYVLESARVSRARDDLAAQQARNDQLRAQITELQRVEILQQQVAEVRALLDQLLATQVRWSGVLRDISLVIPGEAWLTGLTGTLAGETGGVAPPPEIGPGLVGQITFNGFAFDHRVVALWLDRLQDVRGFVNAWLSSSQRTTIGTTEVVQFTSSVDLSRQVLPRRGGAA